MEKLELKALRTARLVFPHHLTPRIALLPSLHIRFLPADVMASQPAARVNIQRLASQKIAEAASGQRRRAANARTPKPQSSEDPESSGDEDGDASAPPLRSPYVPSPVVLAARRILARRAGASDEPVEVTVASLADELMYVPGLAQLRWAH